VNEVQVGAGAGAGGVLACVVTGAPPVQPAGDDESTVRVCRDVAGSQALQGE
jgi:hypothetical protein